MDLVPELGDALNIGVACNSLYGFVAGIRGNLDDPAFKQCREPCRISLCRHPALPDHAHAVAADGLIHVMGRDQNGRPFGRQVEQLFPKQPPTIRIDSGCGFIQKKKFGLMHHTDG